MSGSANTSAPSTQTSTALSVASLASGPTMLAACKQAILHLGGTWPPAGTKTTSDRSASPATFTDKENSGFLAAISTASSPAELKRLCDERTNLESLRRWSSNNWRDTIEMPGKKWAPINGLSKEEAIRVHRLKTERMTLLMWFDANSSITTDGRDSWIWAKKSREFQQINKELLCLTGKKQYYNGMD